MHRQRTHIAARISHVATALERRGIAATYDLHDRAFSNRQSRRQFASRQPSLDDVQQGIVESLNSDGFIVLPLSDLLEEELAGAVLDQGASFVAETEDALAAEASGGSAAGLRRRAGKEFVVRAYSYEAVTLDVAQNAWLRACLSHRLLDVANAYLRMWAKLSYVDLWYTAPQPAGSERSASQLWHRDFDDKHLLKAFVYLVDVDDTAGPFEYVSGSQPGGRYASTWPWAPMTTGRISEDEVSSTVTADAVKTFTAPRGTLILCNTSGLHRGGFATEKPRALATATYCSAASLKALSVRNFTLAGNGVVDPVVQYAVS
jgi:hypothetical protein